jgi:hypothetical protein
LFGQFVFVENFEKGAQPLYGDPQIMDGFFIEEK